MAKPRETLVDFVRDDVLARKIARLAKAELRGYDVRWVDQSISPLGPRIHIEAVRRRYAEAEAQGRPPIELGASMRGKRTYLLTQESIAEELGRAKAPAKAAKRASEAANDTDDEQRAYDEFIAASRKGGAQ